MIGKRFFRLVVVERIPRKGWLCRCDCGKEIHAHTNALTIGMTKSCGCLRVDTFTARNRTHGLSKHPLYSIWESMKARCYNPRKQHAERYHGRGITVCDRWRHDFAAFVEDMSPRPSPKHSLDRVDNDGPYSPENCRWATQTEQLKNRTGRRGHGKGAAPKLYTHNGRTLTLTEWAQALGRSRKTLENRLYAGWPIHLILDPADRRRHD